MLLHSFYGGITLRKVGDTIEGMDHADMSDSGAFKFDSGPAHGYLGTDGRNPGDFDVNDSKESGRNYLALIGWLALTFCASATAVFVKTGGWYAELAKPTWNPPSWMFGPVWTTLYVMMAVSAWLVWRRGGWKVQRGPLTLYLVQWALNALWTPLFFGLHRPGLAFAEIVVLLIAIATTVVAFWRVRRAAGWLLLPYAAWVTFATVLNFTIWRMNA